MSFNWENYLRLSKDLLKTPTESYFRTSISRAYYGTFCLARDKKGYNPSTWNVHQTVISAYENSGNLSEQKIGKKLNELKRARIRSDYNGNIKIKKGLAERMLITACDVLKELKSIP